MFSKSLVRSITNVTRTVFGQKNRQRVICVHCGTEEFQYTPPGWERAGWRAGCCARCAKFRQGSRARRTPETDK